MASSPAFAATPRNASAQISTANTNWDGTGTLGTVFTAGASGSRIDTICIIATVTTAAGMIRLFIFDGTNTRLWMEVLTSAITPSGTVQAANYTLTNLALLLPSGYSLKAGTHNAETWNVIVTNGGDF